MAVEGIVLDNIVLLELSRAVSSGYNPVLYAERNIPEEIAFRQTRSSMIPLLFLVVHATQHLVETVYRVHCTVQMRDPGVSLWVSRSRQVDINLLSRNNFNNQDPEQC